MKSRMKLLCGVLACMSVLCCSAIIAYAMEHASTANTAMAVDTDKAIMCTVVAVLVGIATVVKRHHKRTK